MFSPGRDQESQHQECLPGKDQGSQHPQPQNGLQGKDEASQHVQHHDCSPGKDQGGQLLEQMPGKDAERQHLFAVDHVSACASSFCAFTTNQSFRGHARNCQSQDLCKLHCPAEQSALPNSESRSVNLTIHAAGSRSRVMLDILAT